MEDIFETRRDKEEAFVFRYPLYERFLFVLGLAAAGAAALGYNRINRLFEGSDQKMVLAAYGLIGLFVAACFWISFRAWQSKIIASPTAIKAKYLGQGVERVSWDHINRVVYKWRLLGHVLIFFGTDGSRVRIRSSISGYEKLLRVIRTNAPQPILDDLDDVLGEEEEDEEREEQPAAAKADADEGAAHGQAPEEEDLDEPDEDEEEEK